MLSESTGGVRWSTHGAEEAKQPRSLSQDTGEDCERIRQHHHCQLNRTTHFEVLSFFSISFPDSQETTLV